MSVRVIVAAVVGCTSAAWAGCDDTTVEVTISTFTNEPPDRPPRDPPVEVYIDGLPQEFVVVDYPDVTTAIAAPKSMELRIGDAVVFQRSAIADLTCNGEVPVPEEVHLSYCRYDSGDLRFASVSTSGRGDFCVGDGFCHPQCSTCPGARCTSRATSLDPFASHLACAPIGPKQLGEACTWIADPDGAYDDCGDGLACVAGTCHQRCEASPPDCAGCDYVPGFPPEVRVCP